MKRTSESRTNIALKVFLATLSTAGREERKPEPEPTGKPATVTVERFEDGKWVIREYAWNEAEHSYSIEVANV